MKNRISLTLDKDVVSLLDACAEAEGKSRSFLVQNIVKDSKRGLFRSLESD